MPRSDPGEAPSATAAWHKGYCLPHLSLRRPSRWTFRGSMTRPAHSLCTLRLTVTRFDATLGSGCRPALPGGVGYPLGSLSKGFCFPTSLPPLPGLAWRTIKHPPPKVRLDPASIFSGRSGPRGRRPAVHISASSVTNSPKFTRAQDEGPGWRREASGNVGNGDRASGGAHSAACPAGFASRFLSSVVSVSVEAVVVANLSLLGRAPSLQLPLVTHLG